MNVRVIYDPILRQKVAEVTDFDEQLKREVEQMRQAMKEHAGIGLAANQVGWDKQLIVMEYEPSEDEEDQPKIPFTALCNPKVVKTSQEKSTMNEGCLSLPGLELPVTRPAGVTVEAQDINGKPVKIKAKGLYARVLQHEIDHINGTLFTDRASDIQDLQAYRFAKIVFFGSDDFSLPIFNALIENGLNVIAVITETDKKAGRGQEIKAPIMKQAALDAGIAVLQPETADDVTEVVKQLKPELIILASYGKILKPETLEVPIFGALNIHPSLLPKYRGATPIQSALLAGERETGVSLMLMSAKVDAGGFISQKKVLIDSRDTTPTLKNQLADVGAKLLIQQLPSYLAGQAKIQPQDEKEVTTTKKLTKELGEINWERPVEEIDRMIRALQPWPGAYTFLNQKRLKLLGSYIEDGQLCLTEVQLEGKNKSDWSDFCRGYAEQLKKTSWYGKIS